MKTRNIADDLYWLDAPLGKYYFTKTIRPFIDKVPVRAQRVILRAMRGELHSFEPIEPVRTLREFIALPTKTLVAQRGYRYKTHADLCQVFREHGYTGPLFSGDEDQLPRI